MIHLLESPLAQRLTWTLLHFLWQGAVLGLAAWTGFTLLRRRSPGTRYALGCACLLACLVSAASTLALQAMSTASAVPADGVFSAPSILEAPATVGQAAGVTPAAAAVPWRVHLQPYLPWILAAWVAGVLLLSLRAAGGWLWLRRLSASARPISEPEWLKVLVQRTGLRRTVRFLESVRVATPMCMGLLRPIILLPLGFFTNLDPLAAEAVLAHELAHLRRLDGLVNGLQCVIEVLFFFHPAVWWISRRIRTEREHCCDDAAVLACGDAVFYAETLSRLDELRDRPPSLALLANGGNLMERLRRLLLSEPPRLHLATSGLPLVVTILLFGSVPGQANKPMEPHPAVAEVTSPAFTTETYRIMEAPGFNLPIPGEPPPSIAALASARETNAGLPTTVGLIPNQVPGSVQITTTAAPAVQAAPPMGPSAPAYPQAPQPSPKSMAAFAGPEPTPEEARRIIESVRSNLPWDVGPGITITKVQIKGKDRWNGAFTDHWPKIQEKQHFISAIPKVDGWVIRFVIHQDVPGSVDQALYALITKEGVVYWRTAAPRLPPGLDKETFAPDH